MLVDRVDHRSSTEWTTNEMWKRLAFTPERRQRYRYAYESDGTTVKALAIGDLDCDKELVTFTLQMTVAPDGHVDLHIDTPPRGTN